MRLCAPIVLPVITLLSFYTSFCLAIFADEAYQTDYHHSLLGFPQAHTTFFHRPSAASKASLLYTLSERCVLGAVNPKDGSVVWRHPLSDLVQNITAPGLLAAGEGATTLVSAVDSKVQVWDATDGRLVWEWESDGGTKALEISAASDGKDGVLILSDGETSSSVVRKLAADTGDLLWEFTDGSGDVPYDLVSSKDSVFYISLHSALLKGFKIKVTELASSNGKQIGQPVLLSSDSDVASEASISHVGTNSETPFMIWMDRALKTFKFNTIGTNQISTFVVPSGDGESVENVFIQAPRSPAANPHFLVHYQGAESHWADVYHVDRAMGTAKKAYTLPRLSGKGAFSTSSQGPDVYFTRHTASENILVSSAESTVLSHWNIRPKGHDGLVDPRDISHAVSEVVSRGGTNFAVRSALALSSGDWELIRNGDPFWVRPEGLAGVIAAAFVEIPKEENLAKELAAEGRGGILAAYVHRVKRHARDLEHFPSWAKALPKRAFDSFVGEVSPNQEQSLRRDGFGFHKLIIVATENGRLAALDAGSQGKVIWNIQAVKLGAGEKWEVLSIEAEDGTALIRAQGGEFLRVASTTGTVTKYQPRALIPALKTSIAILDTSGQEHLIPINRDGSLGPIPRANFEKGAVVVTEGEDEVVRGWSLGEGVKPVLAWKFTPASGERVKCVTARPSHDPVASIGKALGDRNVLYKYLNPNVLLITVIGVGDSTATFYLLDSTSGATIHSSTHSGVDISLPIASAISENWFAYSLFSKTSAFSHESSQINQKELQGYQLVISELFESPHPNDRGFLGSSSNYSSLQPSATDEDGTPHVISQNFLIPGPISSMAITSTLQGITTRSLLCFLPDLGAIFSVSRAVLDPRRPVGRDPTAAEMEEGLFKYSAMLDFEPKWFLSHKRDVVSTSKIITSPSLLESTSLVFAFGKLDLFLTRVAPIGSFDMLGKGFSKLQLVLTVVALAIGTTIVAPFVRRKQIDGTWKA